ncbi:MAG: response regulator [bacterium]
MNSNIKILIVEDQIFIAKIIETHLIQMGYKSIFIAKNYHKAMKIIKQKTPDLILLDIHLKDSYTGIDIANEKEVLNRIPFIYLTTSTDQQTLEELIDTKPSAYLSQPIKYQDLKVAISLALIPKYYENSLVNIGNDFTYNLNNKMLLKNGNIVQLSTNEQLLLDKLIQAKSSFVSSEELSFTIWAYEPKSESALRTLIGSLRKKLEFKLIKNKPSLGYKLLINPN